MLVKIPAVQIPAFWEVIKFSAVNADQIAVDKIPSYSIQLLQDLLSDKKSCLIAQEGTKVHFVLIIDIRYDSLRDQKFLFFDNVYSFKSQDLDNWPIYLADILTIAKEAGCNALMGNTKIQSLIDIFMKYGGIHVTNQYAYYL